MSESDRRVRMLVRVLGAQGEVTRAQLEVWFKDLDKDSDGELQESELTCVSDTWRGLALRRLDTDKDQALSQAELHAVYAEADKDGDGTLSKSELGTNSRRQRRGGGRRGGPAPAVGSPAPDFTLKTLDGKSTYTLSTFKDKKPVALIFGSYT